MKKIICFIALLLLPMIVKAYELSYMHEGGIILKGDTINISNPDFYKLYIDGVLVKDFLIDDDGYSYVVAENDMFIDIIEGDETTYITTYYLITAKEDSKILCFVPDDYDNEYFDDSPCEDFIEEGKLYNPMDMVLLSNWLSSVYYYDFDGKYIKETLWESSTILPPLEGENAYWKFDSTDLNQYSFKSAVFKAVRYEAPKFELSCSPKTIYYGDKAVCTISVISPYKLNQASFDLDTESFEVLGVTLPNGVKKVDGERQYNLEMSEDYNQEDEKRVLMTFNITGLKNANYEDSLKVVNIDYIDEVVSGAYTELDGSLEILSYNEKNPETFNKALPVPILLFAFAFLLYGISKMKKESIRF